mmetsp:Transcript_14221/g.42565  ORF Transcript_14221/g.42565 Transcript_14221/m.42565 type:complete len:214 (-) Transcript_14221:1522-2163(-)
MMPNPKPHPLAQSLNAIQAASFLQAHGKTRTATQRNQELADVDLNNDGRIAFIEYLLLHYKVMILQEYYKRTDTEPEEDLSGDGVGITGVGPKLLDELFTLPQGLDPAIEHAIEAFTAHRREKAAKMKQLEDKAAAGGVKGMAAAQELRILQSADGTEENRIELTLAAAKRRASKHSGEEALQAQKRQMEEEMKKKAEDSKARLAARRAMFEK